MLFNYLKTRPHDKNGPSTLVKVIGSVNFSCLSLRSNVFLYEIRTNHFKSASGKNEKHKSLITWRRREQFGKHSN